MKISVFLIGLLVSGASFGCPSIDGFFKSQNGSAKFTTSIQDGIYTYFVNDSPFIADAKQHQETKADLTVNYTAICHDNKWFVNSTIFQKGSQRIQVGTGSFSKIDDETVLYDFSVTLYSSAGDIIQSMPDVHLVFKIQPKLD